MKNKRQLKAKKTWQGVMGVILLIATIAMVAGSLILNLEDMFFIAIIMGFISLTLLVRGSNVKDNILVSGDLVLSYKRSNIFLKVDGYDEDEHDVNKGLTPLEVLTDYNNKRPIVYKTEDKIIHFEQCMVIYCTVNDIKRVYAVLNPIEYKEMGFEEATMVLAYIEAGDDELYPETDKIFQKEFFDIFNVKFENYIKELEAKNKKANNGNDLLGAAKDFSKIMGGIFADAIGINTPDSSKSDNVDAIIQEGAYERKLKYQYYDYDKQCGVYRDEMGTTWYSDDNGETFFK